MNKTVIIIAGPTAAGKTSIGIQLAKHFDTEIISADSRQCYKEMNIGVARPSPEELSAVPHHFIASHSIHDKVTAADFENFALQKTRDIFSSRKVMIMVGGTGLYIKAFCEGLDRIPEVPLDIHQSVIEEYDQKGLTWLQNSVRQHDPGFYGTGEINNPHRLMRALEVYRSTGKSINSFKTGNKAKRDFDIIKVAIELPKEILHRNISNRVDSMMDKGLVNEASQLYSFRHLNALQTVGYKELFEYLDKKISLSAAIELIKQNTRQYAKRQITWFKKDHEFQWLAPDPEPIFEWVNSKM